ncbi:MAG: hypothetical protein ACYTGQ_03990 [Planctomycetota bacterium]|jgi:hypothetical protein
MADHTEIHDSNGIKFQIEVDRGLEGLTSRWTCQDCGATGGSRRVCLDVADAVQAAKTNLRMHYTMRHRGGKKIGMQEEEAKPKKKTAKKVSKKSAVKKKAAKVVVKKKEAKNTTKKKAAKVVVKQGGAKKAAK